MRYAVVKTKRFRKGLKRMLRRGKDLKKISSVIAILANGGTLPPHYKDHALTGDFIGFRDCHVENDWVLIYSIETGELVLTLTDTGTHADLF